MPQTREEFTKDLKDKDLEARFKNVRNGLKLALSKYMLEPESKDVEKVIESFTGLDKAFPKREKSFVDDLLAVGSTMDSIFKDMQGLEELALVQKLSTIGTVYMDRVSEECFRKKLDNFPRYKEKFETGMSEEQEAKSVVPKTIFYSIKLYLDRYYLLFRMYSVNVKAKGLFIKLNKFRDTLINFEYNIAYYLSKVPNDHIKDTVSFKRAMKIAVMRLRKFFEAIDASNFGKLVRALNWVGIENGIRIYIKYNPDVLVKKPGLGLTGLVSLSSILENYETCMSPIRQMISDDDSSSILDSRKFKRHTPTANNNDSKAFWDVADKIKAFRDGMYKVIDDMGVGIVSGDGDYKFFIQTVQSAILPYVSQSRGEGNSTFLIAAKNLDSFFWKLIIKIIENAQENGETVDEILGLSIKVSDKEIKTAMEALNAEKVKIAEIPDEKEENV